MFVHDKDPKSTDEGMFKKEKKVRFAADEFEKKETGGATSEGTSVPETENPEAKEGFFESMKKDILKRFALQFKMLAGNLATHIFSFVDSLQETFGSILDSWMTWAQNIASVIFEDIPNYFKTGSFFGPTAEAAYTFCTDFAPKAAEAALSFARFMSFFEDKKAPNPAAPEAAPDAPEADSAPSSRKKPK